jgi:capsular polysaccharide biosynthesis protein
MENIFVNYNILRAILKWKMHLVIVVIAAIILSAFFSSSLFIKPEFKSTAIVYPANLQPFSKESETEQMLQLMQSNDIMDSVIKKYDLAKHYEINPDSKYFMTKLMNKYQAQVSIRKTSLEAISINVMDIDPKMSCNMVNSIIFYYDKKVDKLKKDKAFEVMSILKFQLDRQSASYDSLENRLYVLSTKFDIFDYKEQSKELAKAENKGNNNGKMQQLKKNLNEKGPEWMAINYLLKREAKMLAKMNYEYESAVKNYNANFTYEHIISSPFPADKKSYPLRSLIVLSSALSALLMAILVILFLENYTLLAFKEEKK